MAKYEDMKKAELVEQVKLYQENFTQLLGEKDQMSTHFEKLLAENKKLKKDLAAAKKNTGKAEPVQEPTTPLYWPYSHSFTEMRPPSIFGMTGTIDLENDWVEVQVPESRVEAALSRVGKRLFEKQEILDFRASQADDMVDEVDEDDTFDEDSE